MEENLEKIEFTQHVLERYVERTMNKTGNEIKQFLVQNEEQVKEQILKLYQYSEPFWYGKNKDHNYTYFRINKNGCVTECTRQPEHMLKRWIAGYMKKAGKSISTKGAERLMGRVGTDMEMLSNELEKCIG